MKTEGVKKHDVETNEMGEADFQDGPFDDTRDVLAPLDDRLH